MCLYLFMILSLFSLFLMRLLISFFFTFILFLFCDFSFPSLLFFSLFLFFSSFKCERIFWFEDWDSSPLNYQFFIVFFSLSLSFLILLLFFFLSLWVSFSSFLLTKKEKKKNKQSCDIYLPHLLGRYKNRSLFLFLVLMTLFFIKWFSTFTIKHGNTKKE